MDVGLVPCTGAESFAPLTGADSFAPLTGAESFAPLTGAESFAPLTGAESFAAHSGMFPCFLGGIWVILRSSSRRAVPMYPRVCDGGITAST